MGYLKRSGSCLLLFLISFQISFSQNKLVETLKSELKVSKHDTIRCDILDQLIEVAAEGEWQKYNEQLSQLYVVKPI